MREIKSGEITDAVAALFKQAGYELGDDILAALKKARREEESPAGQEVLDAILKNADVASKEGIQAVEHMAGKEVIPIDYNTIPGCTYCIPQVASVGFTEKKAKEMGYDLKVGKFPIRVNGKALAMGETEGFIKIIYDSKYGELLGCHIIGPEATELITEVTLAKSVESTYMEVLHTIHPHPTLSEIVAEATHDALGEPIHI